MVRQADIAKKLNISRTTVARALAGKNVSEKTRKKVIQVAEEMGYVHNSAASSLPIQRSKEIYAFIIATIDEGYSNQMEAGIQEIMDFWHGFNIQVNIRLTDINLPGNKCAEQLMLFFDTVKNNPVDGVIFSALSKENLEAVEKYCDEHDIALMTLDLIYKSERLSHIGVDYRGLGALSASLLANSMRDGGRMLILNYDDRYNLSETRMEGFYNRLSQFPHITYKEIPLTDINYDCYLYTLKNALKDYSPDAIYSPYKMDYVIKALHELGYKKDYIMISNGINQVIEDNLFNGKIIGIVSARPYYIGAIATNNMFRYFFRPLEMHKDEITIPCDIYMKENFLGYKNIL